MIEELVFKLELKPRAAHPRLVRQSRNDRQVGAGGSVGLAAALFPAYERRQRIAVGAGESLL